MLEAPRHPHAFGDDPIVVANGVGVDSTALLIGLRDTGVPVALILFADTGSEKPETSAYLPVIGSWLARKGLAPVTVVKRHSPRAGDTSLHGECLRKRVLPSLAYGGHSCSLKWKVDPQWRFTQRYFGWDRRAQRWPHGPFVTKLLGYDAGPADARRIANAAGKWPPRPPVPVPACRVGLDARALRNGDPPRRPAPAGQVGLLHVSRFQEAGA